MSIYYEIRERFSASAASRNCEEAGVVKQHLQRHLSQLFARQLCVTDGISPVHGIRLRLVLDGKATLYEAGRQHLIPLEVQTALTELSDAGQVELDLGYLFISGFGDDLLEEGPFGLTEFLDECPDEVFDCLSYVLHNHADSSNDVTAGIISLYGKRKGLLHKGIVELEDVQELPGFGQWRALNTALMIEEAAIKEGQEHRVREICQALMAMSDADEYDIYDGLLLLNLNNLDLKSPEELKACVALCQELLSLLSPDPADYRSGWFMRTGLLDDSENGPNLLNIQLGLDGRLALSLADARLDALID